MGTVLNISSLTLGEDGSLVAVVSNDSNSIINLEMMRGVLLLGLLSFMICCTSKNKNSEIVPNYVQDDRQVQIKNSYHEVFSSIGELTKVTGVNDSIYFFIKVKNSLKFNVRVTDNIPFLNTTFYRNTLGVELKYNDFSSFLFEAVMVDNQILLNKDISSEPIRLKSKAPIYLKGAGGACVKLNFKCTLEKCFEIDWLTIKKSNGYSILKFVISSKSNDKVQKLIKKIQENHRD